MKSFVFSVLLTLLFTGSLRVQDSWTPTVADSGASFSSSLLRIEPGGLPPKESLQSSWRSYFQKLTSPTFITRADLFNSLKNEFSLDQQLRKQFYYFGRRLFISLRILRI